MEVISKCNNNSTLNRATRNLFLNSFSLTTTQANTHWTKINSNQLVGYLRTLWLVSNKYLRELVKIYLEHRNLLGW